jgi:hypothetical protein
VSEKKPVGAATKPAHARHRQLRALKRTTGERIERMPDAFQAEPHTNSKVVFS